MLPDGAVGELVLTSLTKEALPVIRYRTRDIASLLPPTGSRSMRRIRVVGRSDDMLIIRGVNVFPTQIEELIVGMPALAPHYLLEVGRAGHLDTLTVRVELARDAADISGAVAAELAHKVKAYVGISAKICVEPVGTLERSAGKAQRVIDRRREQQH